MSEKKLKSHSLLEKVFAPFAFLMGSPTNPQAVPFLTTTPKGLVLVHSAPSTAEADLIRQYLENAGFHVEYVPPVTTGAFGTTGSVHVYVHVDQEEDAREFLRQLLDSAGEGQGEDDLPQ